MARQRAARIALVAGAASGLGLETSRQLAVRADEHAVTLDR